ncbi:MAG: glycosyltransferase [Paludibacteraceae bacterium]|nr:glycosyltransferase [Paludibacteraceae bacterium]
MTAFRSIYNRCLSLIHIKRRCFIEPHDIPTSTPLSISYAITVFNEAQALRHLLDTLIPALKSGDEIVIQADKDNVTEEVKQVVKQYRSAITTYDEYSLNFDFGKAKNHLNSLCKGSYIFQLDADELPQPYLLQHLSDLLVANGVELMKVPRINLFERNGIVEKNREAWPDYQGRIYRNLPDRIAWHRPLHERIKGHKSYTYLPKNDDYAILHIKNFEQNRVKWQHFQQRQVARQNEQ